MSSRPASALMARLNGTALIRDAEQAFRKMERLFRMMEQSQVSPTSDTLLRRELSKIYELLHRKIYLLGLLYHSMVRCYPTQGSHMTVRRNISIEPDHLKLLEPLVEQHGGNLSATMRDIIEFADFMIQRYGSLGGARYACLDEKYRSPRELLIEDGFCAMIDYPMFEWFLKRTKGILVDPEILDDIIDPLIINRISELVEHLNRKWKEYGWQTTIIMEYDNDTAPKTAISVITGRSVFLNEFLSGMVGLFLARQKHLGIIGVDRRTRSIRMDLQRRDSMDTAQSDLVRNFGNLHRTADEIQAKPDLWQTLIDLHVESGYNMVTIHRHEFEDLLANRIPLDTTVFERSVREQDTLTERHDFLRHLKHLYETMCIIKHIEINGSKIVIDHDYRDPDSINVIKEMLIRLLAANGYTYTADELGRLIVLQSVDGQ